MRHSPLVLLALLIALALGAVLLLGGDPGADGPAAAGRATDLASEPLRAVESVATAAPPPTGRRVAPAPETDAGPLPSAPEPASAAEPAPDPVVDLEATRPLELRVVDRLGGPVMDARVWIMGHRTDALPGSYLVYRGERPEGRTDFDGRATLEHFEWVTGDGRVSAVDLHVEHPHFVPFRDSGFTVEPGLRTVTLQRGATVTLEAWVGEPDRAVVDLTIRADWDSGVGREDWRREDDGRFTTTRFGPGRHAVRVTGETPEHGRLYSERIEFELEEGGYEDLSVELVPGARLAGRLDPRVPRPVVDGLALLSIHRVSEVGAPTLADQRQVAIDADGEFAFDDLPPGEGQLFALCRGWVCEGRPLDLDLKLSLSEDTSFRELQRRITDPLPRVVVPSPDPVVVAMQPTGSLEVRLVTEDGAPIVDGVVTVSPNYRMLGVGSSIVPGRDWSARTGPDGRARIEDLPPDDGLFVHGGAEGRRLREADRLASPQVAIRPGGTSELTLVLERGD